MEERAYRNVAKKCSETEARGKFFHNLIKAGIGLREIEENVLHEGAKFKGGGGMSNLKRRELVTMFMKEKLKDNILFGVKLRAERYKLRSKVESILGRKSKKARKVIEEVRRYNTKLKCELNTKYEN